MLKSPGLMATGAVFSAPRSSLRRAFREVNRRQRLQAEQAEPGILRQQTFEQSIISSGDHEAALDLQDRCLGSGRILLRPSISLRRPASGSTCNCVRRDLQ